MFHLVTLALIIVELTDGQANGQTEQANLIYTLYGLPRLLLLVTYSYTKLIYLFFSPIFNGRRI